MRVTQALIPTLREVPAEADTISHQLLLRAGMLRRVAAGVYTLLPLGYRVVQKIERIVREEMNRAGGVEMLLPIIQPAELWYESGRWNVYGPELFRLKDRHDRDFCLGPTHEEVITDLVRQEVKSYRQLPLLLYQIQNKYRDERRPRFGLLRGREFIMKDLYSFDRDEEGLEISYRKMYEAYTRIFTRCGLTFRAVEADSGAIGGSDTHEFMVLADTGEAEIVYCTGCDYAADVEKAPCRAETKDACEEMLDTELVATPGARTVREVAEYLNVTPERIIKTLLYEADGELVAVLVRGDRNVNEIKVKNFLGVNQIEIALENGSEEKYGLPLGYVGPVGLKEKGVVKILADGEVRYLRNAVAGANRMGFHYRNVNPDRDFVVDNYGDFRVAEEGDSCPCCHQPLKMRRGIEVGQIFKLGTKYSKALGATVLDEQGNEIPIVMGCYGIGITRTMAAAVEQGHDEDGIIWPVDIAPFEVVIMAVNQRDSLQTEIAEKIYEDLRNAGIDVIYDDRTERPGVKFKDADLIGYPIRLVVGNRAVTDNLLEIKLRSTGEIIYKEKDEAVSYLREVLNRLRKDNNLT
ncbi:MAG TPA: proline--tRNA ligase [Syntrophomonadaceae bacterium]|nr:proline--tRNA ligase [Syntrophomonadaceae bacterium]